MIYINHSIYVTSWLQYQAVYYRMLQNRLYHRQEPLPESIVLQNLMVISSLFIFEQF